MDAGNASIYAMYIYVYTDNSNSIITCIQDTQHTINRELYLYFDLRRPSTLEQGYDSIGAMASQDSHGPQSISTWSSPRYQTSTTLQPFKPQQHSNQQFLIPHMHVPPHECTPSLSHSPSTATPPFPWGSTTCHLRKSQSTMAPGLPTALRDFQSTSSQATFCSQHSNFNPQHLIYIIHMQLSWGT